MDKDFKSRLIKELLNYYKDIDENANLSNITDERIKAKILSAQKSIKPLPVNSNDAYDIQASKKRYYDLMREKLNNFIDALECPDSEVYPGISFDKPQFFIDKYKFEEAFNFVKSYLEIISDTSEDKKSNRTLKYDINKKIDINTDFSKVNDILLAMNKPYAVVPFDNYSKQFTIIENFNWGEITNLRDFLLLTDESLKTYDEFRRKSMEYLNTVVLNTINKLEYSDFYRSFGEYSHQYMVALMLKILFKALMQIINQIIVNMRDKYYENYKSVCQKIEAFIIKPLKYQPSYNNIETDFQEYNISLDFRNTLLSEMKTQMYNLKYIESLADINEKYILVDNNNIVKEDYESNSLSLDEMNDLFNLGTPIDKDIFKDRLVAIKEFIPLFNSATKRNLYPNDILAQRAVYRVLFKAKPHKFNENLKANDSKNFIKLWNSFIENHAELKTDLYFAYSNAISSSLAIEYRGGKKNMTVKVELFKSLCKVFNSFYINFIPAAGSTLGIDEATDIILKYYNKISDILNTELYNIEFKIY